MFIASPVIADHSELIKLGKRLKKEKVSIDIINFGEEEANSAVLNELINTINRYLSPWAFEEEDDVYFANEIEFSSIIQLLDNQSYVDYITDFKVAQYQLDENNEIVGNAIQNLSKISPQSDFTLFIPTETHVITEIN